MTVPVFFLVFPFFLRGVGGGGQGCIQAYEQAYKQEIIS